MSRYEIVEMYAGADVSQAVRILKEKEKEGAHAKTVFNGEWLYSDVDSEDDMYIKITGRTKEEHKLMMKKELDEIKKRKEEHEKNIPRLEEEYKRKGREVLAEDKWEHWDKVVPVRLRDLYKGMELDNLLEIETLLLNGGTLEEAKDVLYTQGHSGMSFSLVRQMIKEFSFRGQELYDYLDVKRKY